MPSDKASNATPPMDINLSTEPRVVDVGRCGALGVVHENIVELGGRVSCCTVSSSSKSIAAESSVVGLRPLDADGFLSLSIACPHFQQNAYFASIIDPQSGHALAPGCSFGGAGAGAGGGGAAATSSRFTTGGWTTGVTTGFGFGCSLITSRSPVVSSVQPF